MSLAKCSYLAEVDTWSKLGTASAATSNPEEALLAGPASEQGGGKRRCGGTSLLWRKSFLVFVENMTD